MCQPGLQNIIVMFGLTTQCFNVVHLLFYPLSPKKARVMLMKNCPCSVQLVCAMACGIAFDKRGKPEVFKINDGYWDGRIFASHDTALF